MNPSWRNYFGDFITEDAKREGRLARFRIVASRIHGWMSEMSKRGDSRLSYDRRNREIARSNMRQEVARWFGPQWSHREARARMIVITMSPAERAFAVLDLVNIGIVSAAEVLDFPLPDQDRSALQEIPPLAARGDAFEVSTVDEDGATSTSEQVPAYPFPNEFDEARQAERMRHELEYVATWRQWPNGGWWEVDEAANNYAGLHGAKVFCRFQKVQESDSEAATPVLMRSIDSALHALGDDTFG